MARPKKDEKNLLKRTVGIRLTESEFAQLEADAEKAIVHPTTLARMKYLGNVVEIKVRSKTDEALVREVIRIGININQIQKAINSDVLKGRELDVESINKSLSEALNELYKVRSEIAW